MPDFEWLALLNELNRDLLECPHTARLLPRNVVRSGWLGYPPATEVEVRKAETRLDTTLPPSYREFLKATNGWRRGGLYVGRVLGTNDVEWFRTRNQHWIDNWFRMLRSQGGPVDVPDTEYLTYGTDQRPEVFRDEYLLTALQVSEIEENSYYILNPQIVTPEGEWEAWFFAPWLPGARRYRSFWDLMEQEHDILFRLKGVKKD